MDAISAYEHATEVTTDAVEAATAAATAANTAAGIATRAVADNDDFDGADGEDSVDGFSSVATVVATDGGATITITDRNGTTSAVVAKGDRGDAASRGRRAPRASAARLARRARRVTLPNVFTFGNIQHSFNLMKTDEKDLVCKMIAESTGRNESKSPGYFGVDDARVSLEVLVKFRNLCAHVGSCKNVGYSKMIWMLECLLTDGDFHVFLRDLTSLVEDYLRRNAAGAHLLNNLGIPEMMLRMQRRIGAQ